MATVGRDEEGAWIAAFMRAAGVREFRIPDEWIWHPEFSSVLRYRDEMADLTVFRLVVPGDVIDAEEVSSVELAIGGPDQCGG